MATGEQTTRDAANEVVRAAVEWWQSLARQAVAKDGTGRRRVERDEKRLLDATTAYIKTQWDKNLKIPRNTPPRTPDK